MKGIACVGLALATIVSFSVDCVAQSSGRVTYIENVPDLDKVVCGPKCVGYVLSYYGIQVEISDLIKEVQWPDYDKGSTMDALARSLQGRGIHVRAVLVPTCFPLHWKRPIIIHLTDQKEGHFAVVKPIDNQAQNLLWLNERFQQTMPLNACVTNRSEIVLLTADKEITDDALSEISLSQLDDRIVLVGLPLLPFLVMLIVLLLWKRGGQRVPERK